MVQKIVKILLIKKGTVANTRLEQLGLTSFIESLCFFYKFVLADSLVFQNPPLRQAWERQVVKKLSSHLIFSKNRF